MIIKVFYNSGMLCFRWEVGDQKSNNEEVSISKSYRHLSRPRNMALLLILDMLKDRFCFILSVDKSPM